MKNRFLICVLVIILSACGDDELLIPRPIANLRVEFPERSYKTTAFDCPFKFDLASYMTAKSASQESPCHLDIHLGKFNGMLHLSYVQIDNNLGELIAYSVDKVKEHQVKASAIQDSTIVDPKRKFFGTFYEFYGNAATPFQFHFTDSTKHFIRGTVYFNATPNFDSIYPVLQYVKQDFVRIMTSNQWK